MAAQGLHMQHMAVYSAYGCWLAGHRGPDLREHAHWRVKWRIRGPNSKEHYCQQQAAMQQYSKLHAVSYMDTEAAMLPTCQNCKYCHTAKSNLPELQRLPNYKLQSHPSQPGGPQGGRRIYSRYIPYIYIYIYIYNAG